MTDYTGKFSEVIAELSRIADSQEKIAEAFEAEIVVPGDPIPDVPVGNQPIYSTGAKGIRNVQMGITTRLSIPKIKNGEIVYTYAPDGTKKGMQHVKPTTTLKVYKGDVWDVFAPHVQGDGTRLYEVYDYPGRFIRGNTCALV